MYSGLCEFETRKTSVHKIINYDVYTYISLSRRSSHSALIHIPRAERCWPGLNTLSTPKYVIGTSIRRTPVEISPGTKKNTFTNFERSAYILYNCRRTMIIPVKILKNIPKLGSKQIFSNQKKVFVHIFYCDSFVCLIFP